MQKKNTHYSFLLTHTTKSKVFIRRIEISKRVLHSSLATVVLATGLFSFGAYNWTKTEASFASDEQPPAAVESLLTAQTGISPTEVLPKTNDYNRAANAETFSINSGGPDNDLQMTEEEIEQAQKGDVELQIRLIQSTASPNSLPSIWAHLGKINNEFGFRRNPFGGRSYEFHAGMDIDGEKGDPVVAPGDGVVVKSGWQGGYGYMIEIDHGNGITTRYGHLSKVEVASGDTVTRGQLIGQVGSTGRSTGPHLHYELRLNDKPVNPRLLLPPEPTDIRQG